jgi:hypothetical protein
MCIEHAAAIDDPVLQTEYPSAVLHEWKREQRQEFERIQQGWVLNEQMAEEVLHASKTAEILISQSTIHLGGEGGKGPGAGGGGGGAIGRNARGGRGGKGGKRSIDTGEFTVSLPEIAFSDVELHCPEDSIAPAPGAGGGGAGAIGDGAIGGDGGDGGDQVISMIDLAELDAAGFDHAEVIVGKGGQGSQLPGALPIDGEDSVINFHAKDGRIIKQIRATGGKTKSNSTPLPDGVAEASIEDISNGLRATTLMLVNYAEFREGLVFIVGGNWGNFPVPSLPVEAVWTVVSAIHSKESAAGKALFLSLFNPENKEVSRQTLIIPLDAPAPCQRQWINQLGAKFDTAGSWSIRLHANGFLFCEYPIEVAVKLSQTPPHP